MARNPDVAVLMTASGSQINQSSSCTMLVLFCIWHLSDLWLEMQETRPLKVVRDSFHQFMAAQLWGDTKAFPDHSRDSLASYVLKLKALSGSTCLKHHTREAFESHSYQIPEPPQLPSLNAKEQWFYSELLLDG